MIQLFSQSKVLFAGDLPRLDTFALSSDWFIRSLLLLWMVRLILSSHVTQLKSLSSIRYCNKWENSYQLKLCDVAFPPQIRTHLWTNRRQTIISIHDHVNKTIACCTEVSWKERQEVRNLFQKYKVTKKGVKRLHKRYWQDTYRHLLKQNKRKVLI